MGLSRRWIALVTGLVALGGLGLFGRAIVQRPAEIAGRTPGSRLSLEADNPLGPQGRPIPVDVALGVLRSCSCPRPPDTGVAGLGQIVGTWADVETGLQIGIRFSSGLTLTYTPDPRSPRQYAEDVEASIAGGDLSQGEGAFHLIDLLGTQAMAKEADPHGPASISWIERGRLIALIGYGGESLDDLVSIANAMSS